MALAAARADNEGGVDVEPWAWAGLALVAAALLAAPAQSQSVLRVAPRPCRAFSTRTSPHRSLTRDLGYLIYDTLFAVDENFEPAADVRELHVSPDKLTYVFVLRPGLKWHDASRDGGRLRGLDPSLGGRATAWARRSPSSRLARGHRRQHDQAVLTAPYGLCARQSRQGRSAGALHDARAHRPHAGSEQVKEIVGSGPYKFRNDLPRARRENRPGEVRRLQATQRAAELGVRGQIAKLDRVEMLGMPDAQTQVNALIRGEVDYLERVPADLLPLFGAKSGAKAEVISKLGFQAIMRMNHLQPPFDNLKVRQAIAKAVDRSMYAAVVAGDPSFATDCAAIFGCGMPYDSKDGHPGRATWPPPRRC